MSMFLSYRSVDYHHVCGIEMRRVWRAVTASGMVSELVRGGCKNGERERERGKEGEGERGFTCVRQI